MPYYNRDPKRDPNFDNHPHGPALKSRKPQPSGGDVGVDQNYGPFWGLYYSIFLIV